MNGDTDQLSQEDLYALIKTRDQLRQSGDPRAERIHSYIKTNLPQVAPPVEDTGHPMLREGALGFLGMFAPETEHPIRDLGAGLWEGLKHPGGVPLGPG